MISKTFLAGLAVVGMAIPAAAQVVGGPADAPPTARPPIDFGPSGAMDSGAPPVDSGPVRGAIPPIVSEDARVGASANVSATVTEAELRTGASVKDAAGADLGRISKVETVDGQTMVTLSSSGRTTTVPASSLSSSTTGLVSSASKTEVWAPR